MSKINSNSLLNYLNDLFPQAQAAEWDTVGLQIEEVYNLPSQDEISGVVVCLDVTEAVVEKAISKKANFIISRHPFLFETLEIELENPAKKAIYAKLLEHEIQVFSIHTNYDNSTANNMIDLLKTRFNIKNFESVGAMNEGLKIEFLREISVQELIDNLKFIFGKQHSLLTRETDMNKEVKKIYLTPGAGAETMINLRMKNVFFVTGEVKWHEWLYAEANNIDLLTIGHYMENHFIDDIKTKLFKTFPVINVYEFDLKNPFKYV